jgi:hypothetical protein
MKNEKKSKDKADEEAQRKEALEDDVLIVQEPTKISDGIHTGKIANMVHENREGFDYIDIYIGIKDDNGKDVNIKTGFPAYLSTNSSLGRFLMSAGISFAPTDKITLSGVMQDVVGKEVSFQTYTEDNFARVVNKTIKFA